MSRYVFKSCISVAMDPQVERTLSESTRAKSEEFLSQHTSSSISYRNTATVHTLKTKEMINRLPLLHVQWHVKAAASERTNGDLLNC